MNIMTCSYDLFADLRDCTIQLTKERLFLTYLDDLCNAIAKGKHISYMEGQHSSIRLFVHNWLNICNSVSRDLIKVLRNEFSSYQLQKRHITSLRVHFGIKRETEHKKGQNGLNVIRLLSQCLLKFLEIQRHVEYKWNLIQRCKIRCLFQHIYFVTSCRDFFNSWIDRCVSLISRRHCYYFRC